MNKVLLYIASLVLVVVSCDDTEDYFEGENKKPALKIYDQDGVVSKDISDSIKVGFTLEYQFVIEDEENLLLSIENNRYASIEIKEEKITVTGLEPGFSEVSFSVNDAYGLRDETDMLLTVYQNLPPVAKLDYQIVRLDDSYVLELYGSKSYDQDTGQGGGVVEYQYTISTYSKITTEKIFRFSINDNATYIVKFRVRDNDGAWSEEIIKIIYS